MEIHRDVRAVAVSCPPSKRTAIGRCMSTWNTCRCRWRGLALSRRPSVTTRRLAADAEGIESLPSTVRLGMTRVFSITFTHFALRLPFPCRIKAIQRIFASLCLTMATLLIFGGTLTELINERFPTFCFRHVLVSIVGHIPVHPEPISLPP